MGLLSFFKRKDESPAGDTPAADAVAQARIRARRRLIGATVLLGIGVIGFPLLFETQPRPIPVDIPIEIPRKESAPPLALPSARAPAAVVAEPPVAPAEAPAPSPASTPRAAAPVITERATDQGREVASPSPGTSGSPSRAAAASTPAARTAAAPASTPAARAAAAPASAAAPRSTADAQRAQALLEGRSTPPKAASQPGSLRLVVQVGAYTDADKLRDARQKVEKLGMKTYTQVVEADGAKRTRVRVGPFATREEADKAAARIKAAGLPVAVLTL